MSSTSTLRNDPARTGTTPDFPISGNPWTKYLSVDLGAPVRAGVLVVENWVFAGGPNSGQAATLVLVATAKNEVYCYSEGELLLNPNAAAPIWQTDLQVPPMQRATSNIPVPIGISGTPVVDTSGRRLFVVAMWQDNNNVGHYTIFELDLDTGAITGQRELTDLGAPGRATFNPDVQDQRTAINLIGEWLWLGFADYRYNDYGRYYGWVVAIKANDLTRQLYQPMVSLNSTNNWGIYGGGVWGPGGVAAGPDGSVYVLTGNATQLDSVQADAEGTNPQDDLQSFGMDYWANAPAAGPGSQGDYFNGVVRLGIVLNGAMPELTVLDWFQASDLTKDENKGDLDFGGSSPVLLPPIDGKQLVAFVPKDGNIFALDSQSLGHYSHGLVRTPYGDSSSDTKVAIAYVAMPDGSAVLVVGANSVTATVGGCAAFKLDASRNPPTLTQLWQAQEPLHDSFGSPTVITNPLPDPSRPPNPFALAWVADGLDNWVMRAYDVESGALVYSSTPQDVKEGLLHFAPITAGGRSVFCATAAGFMGFTQFVVPSRSLTFIIDKSTFGKDEVDNAPSYSPAYWMVLDGTLPSELGITSGNLVPAKVPAIASSANAPQAVQIAINGMLNVGGFAGSVIPEDPDVPDVPQAFLFPYAIDFNGDGGFTAMDTAGLDHVIVTLNASIDVVGPLASSAQIELVKGADPYFVDIDPNDPTQPSWLSFDLRLFTVTVSPGGNVLRFGAQMSDNRDHAPGFIAQAIANLTANLGDVNGDTFDGLTQSEGQSALAWNPIDQAGNRVFNFAVARVRLTGKAGGPTATPVRVFFRLFQAQNTVSSFDPTTTYRTGAANDIALLGVESNEYLTIPCFATRRVNLGAAVSMAQQTDAPNAQVITLTPGTEVDTYFGCWIDNNQPDQKLLPADPPPANQGGDDGPWTGQMAAGTLESIHSVITVAPHQCLIAEINYAGTPVVPGATSSTSDKLAQRNIAWIDGPNPGAISSRRMAHPVQVRPTARLAAHPDELMITWGATPRNSYAELYLPAGDATRISNLANQLRSWLHIWAIDPNTIGFAAEGVTFVPLPVGSSSLAGLLTVVLPPGIRRGEHYEITVRQVTDQSIVRAQSSVARSARAQTVAGQISNAYRRVVGAFQFGINISTAEELLLKEERLLATLRALALTMAPRKRWYPVLQRYIDDVSTRVAGFGGNPGAIMPSADGWVPGMVALPGGSGSIAGHGGDDQIHDHGKIAALIYDHFGDFVGVLVESHSGQLEEFQSREEEIREVASQAQRERRRVHIVAERWTRKILRLVVF